MAVDTEKLLADELDREAERVAITFLGIWYDWTGDPQPWWDALYDANKATALRAARTVLAALRRVAEPVDRVERVAKENKRLRQGLRNVISAADSFCDDSGDEVAAQVKIRARAALEDTPDGN